MSSEQDDVDDTNEGIGVDKPDAPIVSFSRSNYRPSYLGSTVHGRSSMIAGLMTGVSMSTTRIGSVIGVGGRFATDDDGSDAENSNSNEEDDEDLRKSSKSSKTPSKKKQNAANVSKTPVSKASNTKKHKGSSVQLDSASVEAAPLKAVNEAEKEHDSDKVNHVEDENENSSIEADILAAAQNLVSEDSSINWNMKRWAVEMSTYLGISITIFDEPYLKRYMKETILELSAQFVEQLSQSQSQTCDDVLVGTSQEQEQEHSNEDDDKSSISLTPLRKKKTYKPRKQKKEKKNVVSTLIAGIDGEIATPIEKTYRGIVPEEPDVYAGLGNDSDLDSIHSDSNSSVSSKSSRGSMGSAAGEILGDVRGRRKATKDPRLKKKREGKEVEIDINRSANEELAAVKAIENGETRGLVSAAEFILLRDSEDAEYESRKLTKFALKELTAGERSQMAKTKAEASESRQWLLSFCEQKGLDVHAEKVKDVIKYQKLDPSAWKGLSWSGPGQVERFIFEGDDILLADDDYDVGDEIMREEMEDEEEGLEIVEEKIADASLAKIDIIELSGSEDENESESDMASRSFQSISLADPLVRSLLPKTKIVLKDSPDSLAQVATDSPLFIESVHQTKKTLDFDYTTPSAIQSRLVAAFVKLPQQNHPSSRVFKKILPSKLNPRAQVKAKLLLEATKQCNVTKEKRWKKNNEGWILTWNMQENMKVEYHIARCLALWKQKERLRQENEIFRAEKSAEDAARRLADRQAIWQAAADDDDEEAEFDPDMPVVPRQRKTIEDREDGESSNELERDELNRGGEDDNDDEKEEQDGIGEGIEEEESRRGSSQARVGEEDEEMLTYSRKRAKTVIDDDDDPVATTSDKALESDAPEGEIEVEAEELPLDPIERMKLERKKAQERSKNYRAQVMLEEARARKSKKSSNFVEDEAEEEDEEGLQGGLADYGFGTGAKDKEHDDEKNALKMRKDDFDNIVDELSDDEGDEEAGEAARMKIDMKRDQQQTKEIIDAVIYGKDKFKNLRNQGALLNEDEKALNLREKGEQEEEEEDFEDFDDEAYYAQTMKSRDEELKKERDRQKQREEEEAAEEAEEAENVNVSEMNGEERRQYEHNKLVHNKIAKEFQAKARMNFKLRRMLSKQNSERGIAGNSLGSLGSLAPKLALTSLSLSSTDIPPDPYGLQRSHSEMSRPAPLSSRYEGGGGKIGMTIDVNFDSSLPSAPLSLQRSLSSSGSSLPSAPLSLQRSLSSSGSFSVPISKSSSNDGFSLLNADTSQPVLSRASSSSVFQDLTNKLREDPGLSHSSVFPLKRTATESSRPPLAAAITSSLYQGTINQVELDAGYGMGMAITKKRKDVVMTASLTNSTIMAPPGSLFSAVTSNSTVTRTFSGVDAGAGGRRLKRIRPMSSAVTVTNKQFVFSETSALGGNSMSGWEGAGAAEGSRTTGLSLSASIATASGSSLFEKISSVSSNPKRSTAPSLSKSLLSQKF